MRFQELMKGAIESGRPVWIISGQSSLPESCLAIVTEVQESHILTMGARLEFGSSNLFLMFGTTLFGLEHCKISKAPHGQLKLSFDSVVQVFPKVASGFAPTIPVPSLSEMVKQAVPPPPTVPMFSVTRDDDDKYVSE